MTKKISPTLKINGFWNKESPKLNKWPKKILTKSPLKTKTT